MRESTFKMQCNILGLKLSLRKDCSYYFFRNELYAPLNNFYLQDIFEETVAPSVVSDYADREKLPASPESVPPPLISSIYCSTAEPTLPGISRAMESMTAIR